VFRTRLGSVKMCYVYVFEATIIKTGNKYLIYPPKDYQEKLRKYHGKKVKVLVAIESD
jgi:hypothetical protein